MLNGHVFAVRLLVGALGLVALGAGPQASSQASGPTYQIIDLGVYGPAAMNDEHQIALSEQLVTTPMPGGDGLSSRPFAALWQSGNLRVLADADEYAAAAGINNDGQVVGYGPAAACDGCARTTEARLWNADGTAESLPDVPGSPGQPTYDGAEAQAINDRGDIAGWAFRYVNRGLWQRAARWRDGRGELLGSDNGGPSAAFALNDLGDAVGWAEFTAADAMRAPQRAALWVAAAPSTTDLGTLGGPRASSVAYDVNNAREVVGASDDAAGQRRAFVWRRGVMSDLGTLAGDTDAEARAINARGEIVGTSFRRQCGTFNGQTRYFLLVSQRTHQ